MHRRVNFSAGLEIGSFGRLGKYFSARLPSEGRSKRGALVDVLVDRNGGCRKISLAAEYSDGDCGFPKLTTR